MRRPLSMLAGLCLLFVMLSPTTNAGVFPATNEGKTTSFPGDPGVELLCKDAQFIEMTNLVIGFSVDISRNKAQEALSRYSQHTASEADIKKIVEASALESIEEVNGVFTKINDLQRSIAAKYSFMQNNERGQTVLREALMKLAKKGSISKVKQLDVDCLASAMAAFSLCYWMMDQCNMIGTNGGDNSNCVIGVTACLALAFIASDQCFNLHILD